MIVLMWRTSNLKILSFTYYLDIIQGIGISLHGTVVRLVVSSKGEIKTTVVKLARNIKPFDFEFASSN